MINLLQTELYKLRKNQSFWKVCIAMVCVYSCMFYLIAIGWWGMDESALYSIGLKEYNAVQMLTRSLFYNFFISTLAASFINADHSIGVVKNQIICGHSRAGIYAAKLMIFALANGFIISFIPFVISFIIIFLNGQAGIYSYTNVMFLIKSHLLFALGTTAYSAFVMLIASAVKESGKTILLTVLISFVAYSIEMLFVQDFPTVERLYSFTVFAQGFVAFKVDNNIFLSVLIYIINFALLLTWGCLRFKKEEIK